MPNLTSELLWVTEEGVVNFIGASLIGHGSHQIYIEDLISTDVKANGEGRGLVLLMNTNCCLPRHP